MRFLFLLLATVLSLPAPPLAIVEVLSLRSSFCGVRCLFGLSKSATTALFVLYRFRRSFAVRVDDGLALDLWPIHAVSFARECCYRIAWLAAAVRFQHVPSCDMIHIFVAPYCDRTGLLPSAKTQARR